MGPAVTPPVVAPGITAWATEEQWAKAKAEGRHIVTLSGERKEPITRTLRKGGREVSFKEVWIPPGEYWMGYLENSAADKATGGYDNEKPAQRVQITQGFWMMETPVSQQLYEFVVGINPATQQPEWFGENGVSAKYPVYWVSQIEAETFNQKLTGLLKGELDGGSTYRLPLEGMWEWAARGGKEFAWAQAEAGSISRYANGRDTKSGYDWWSPVGALLPNGFDLKDMSGNVWEWCSGEYANYTDGLKIFGQIGSYVNNQFEKSPLRGGSWVLDADGLRVAFRFRSAPNVRSRSFGFRAARLYP